MYEEVAMFRLYLVRAAYLLNFVGLGPFVWPEVINGFGRSLSVKNAAFATSVTVLQVDMVNRSCAPAAVRRANTKPHQNLSDPSNCGSNCYSLAVCSGHLCKDSWKSLEINRIGPPEKQTRCFTGRGK